MNARVAIVSAGDDAYLALIEDWIASIQALELPAHFSLNILDLGFSAQNRSALAQGGANLITPDWRIDFPGKGESPNWFRAMTTKLFLPQYFPDHDVYLWIDADAWVQDMQCLLQLATTTDDAISVVATTFFEGVSARGRQPNGRTFEVYVNVDLRRKNIEDCYRLCFGETNAQRAYETVINAGVFALSAKSDVWNIWADYLRSGLDRGINKLVEERALNLGILEGRIPYRLLPQRYNWDIGARRPWVDTQSRCLVDPDAPAYPLGIVHLLDLKQCDYQTVRSLEGESINVPLRYRDFCTWRSNSDEVAQKK